VTEDEAKTKWKRGAPRGDYDDRYPLADRLADLSTPEPNTGCIIWLGATNDSGYGRMKVRRRFRRAHIIAWEIECGAVPEGLVLDHTCRVRCCINPTHLEAVTQGENLRRGRIARGLSR